MTSVNDTLQNTSIEELEAQIQNLNVERNNYINENSKKTPTENNLKNSILKSVENQAKKKGYKIKN